MNRPLWAGHYPPLPVIAVRFASAIDSRSAAFGSDSPAFHRTRSDGRPSTCARRVWVGWDEVAWDGVGGVEWDSHEWGEWCGAE